MDIAIMIEGQDGLTWPRWQNLARAVEDLGFSGLFRSDHFTNARPPEKDSLEMWVSLTWLASHTQRIEFGPLVSPVSFRHPAMTARMASAVDDLSGGRLILGLGAGWQVREHEMFGFDLLEVGPRFDRFEEGLEVVTRLFRGNEPVNYAGKYFQLNEAILLPRPTRPGGPRIAIGGNGLNRTMKYAARYADEWNAVYIPANKIAELNQKLDELLFNEGCPRDSVRRSAMLGCVFGRTMEEVKAKLVTRKMTLEEFRKMGGIVGTGDMLRDQLQELTAIGLQRVMLQWLDQEDLPGLVSMAKEIH
jgi:F420-dependent oxidoreductase-like protein